MRTNTGQSMCTLPIFNLFMGNSHRASYGSRSVWSETANSGFQLGIKPKSKRILLPFLNCVLKSCSNNNNDHRIRIHLNKTCVYHDLSDINCKK